MSFKKTKAHIGKVCPTILVLALLTYLYVPLNSMMADLALKVPQINWMLYFQELVHPMTMTEDEGAKYLGFFSSCSLKMREKYISFAQFVYFLREECLLFNFIIQKL